MKPAQTIAMLRQRIVMVMVVGLLAILAGANVYLSARLSSDGEALRSLEQKASELRHANQILEQKLLMGQSLTQLEPEAEKLGFVPKPTSLIIPADSSVAQLIESF